MRAALAVLLIAGFARADVVMTWAAQAKTILVAHDGRIEGFDGTGEKRLWSAEGVASPSAIVTSKEYAAILDGFHDRVVIVSLRDGSVRSYDVASTPVAAAFFKNDLWVIVREPSRVRRITPDGNAIDTDVGLDPAFIGASDRFVYVYSRADGVLQEIDPQTAKMTRNAAIGRDGSDLEIQLPRPGGPPGATAFVCRAAAKKISAVDLKTMFSHEISGGTVPIDLAFVPFGSELSLLEPGYAIIADPARAALYASSNPGPSHPIRMPTAADRLTITAAGLFAFDSSGGTLYRVDGRKVTRVASGLTPLAFAVTSDAVFTWDANAGRPVPR